MSEPGFPICLRHSVRTSLSSKSLRMNHCLALSSSSSLSLSLSSFSVVSKPKDLLTGLLEALYIIRRRHCRHIDENNIYRFNSVSIYNLIRQSIQQLTIRQPRILAVTDVCSFLKLQAAMFTVYMLHSVAGYG